MFFALSKILWWLVRPDTLLLLPLAAGTGLLWTGERGRRWGARVISAVLVGAVLIAVVPAGPQMIVALENRFPPVRDSDLPPRVGGIVVLGGVVDQFVTASRGQLAINGAAERLIEFVRLAKRYPEARLVFSGGSGDLLNQDLKEADSVAVFVKQLGLDPARIVFENQSRNTAENAVFSKVALDPRQDLPWILITSAFHMPRAAGCFRQQGWPIIPYPVDFNYPADLRLEPGFGLGRGLQGLDAGIHEWLGLFMYWVTGRTESLVPGP